MPKLQCPKCKQPIELKALPADNKVKCGSCSAEFALKAPVKAGASASASKPSSGAPAASKPTAPAGTQKAAKPAATQPSSASKQAPAKPSAGGAPVSAADPNDPFAALDLNSIGKSKRVDFGVAPIPAGVTESPIGNNAPWLAENKPAYKPLSEQEAAALASGNPYQATADGSGAVKPKKSNLGINIFVIVVLVAMAGGSLAAAIIVAMK